MDKFGEDMVHLTERAKNNGYLGKMKEVKDPAKYIFNSEMLFNKGRSIKDVRKFLVFVLPDCHQHITYDCSCLLFGSLRLVTESTAQLTTYGI